MLTGLPKTYLKSRIRLWSHRIAWMTLFFFISSLPAEFLLPVSSAQVTQENPEFPLNLSIPAEWGSLQGFYPGKSQKTLLYIQDAHNSFEAQINIAHLIHFAVKEYGAGLVFEEGYEGDVPTDPFFKAIPDPGNRRKVSYYLLDKLRVSAAEYAHINRTEEFKLVGADHLALYLKNVEAYRQAAASREGIERDLTELKRQISTLIQKRFPSALNEWLKIKAQKDTGVIDLLDYLKRTEKLYKKSQTEDGFPKQYPRTAEILRMASGHPDFDQERVEVKAFFEELNRLEEDFGRSFLTDSVDKQILEFDRVLSLLFRLSRIELSFEEYRAVKPLVSRFSTQRLADFLARQSGKTVVLSSAWETQIKSALRFYDLAEAREENLRKALKSFLDQKSDGTAVLVFGGFHKQAILRLMEEEGIACAVIAPKIREIDPRHENYYRNLMSGGSHFFESSPAAGRLAPNPRYLTLEAGGLLPETSLRSELRRLSERAENLSFPLGDDFIHAMDYALKQENTRSEFSPLPTLSQDKVSPASPAGRRSELRGEREEIETPEIPKPIQEAIDRAFALKEAARERAVQMYQFDRQLLRLFAKYRRLRSPEPATAQATLQIIREMAENFKQYAEQIRPENESLDPEGERLRLAEISAMESDAKKLKTHSEALKSEISGLSVRWAEANRQAEKDPELLSALNKQLIALQLLRIKTQLLQARAHLLASDKLPNETAIETILMMGVYRGYLRLMQAFSWRWRSLIETAGVPKVRILSRYGDVKLVYDYRFFRIFEDPDSTRQERKIVIKSDRWVKRTLPDGSTGYVLEPRQVQLDGLDKAFRSQIHALQSQDEDYAQILNRIVMLDYMIGAMEDSEDVFPDSLREETEEILGWVMHARTGGLANPGARVEEKRKAAGNIQTAQGLWGETPRQSAELFRAARDELKKRLRNLERKHRALEHRADYLSDQIRREETGRALVEIKAALDQKDFSSAYRLLDLLYRTYYLEISGEPNQYRSLQEHLSALKGRVQLAQGNPAHAENQVWQDQVHGLSDRIAKMLNLDLAQTQAPGRRSELRENEATREITLRNKLGLHARPSMAVLDLTTLIKESFDVEVSLSKGETVKDVDASSIMHLMMLAAGDQTVLTVKIKSDKLPSDTLEALLGLYRELLENDGKDGENEKLEKFPDFTKSFTAKIQEIAILYGRSRLENGFEQALARLASFLSSGKPVDRRLLLQNIVSTNHQSNFLASLDAPVDVPVTIVLSTKGLERYFPSQIPFYKFWKKKSIPWRIVFTYSPQFESYLTLYGNRKTEAINLAEGPADYIPSVSDEDYERKVKREFHFGAMQGRTSDNVHQRNNPLDGAHDSIVARPGADKGKILELWAQSLVTAGVLGQMYIASSGTQLAESDMETITRAAYDIDAREAGYRKSRSELRKSRLEKTQLPPALGGTRISNIPKKKWNVHGVGPVAALLAVARNDYLIRKYFGGRQPAELKVAFWGTGEIFSQITHVMLYHYPKRTGFEFMAVSNEAQEVFAAEGALPEKVIKSMLLLIHRGKNPLDTVADKFSKEEVQSFPSGETPKGKGVLGKDSDFLFLVSPPETFTLADAKKFRGKVILEANPNAATLEAIEYLNRHGKLFVPYSLVNIGGPYTSRQEFYGHMLGQSKYNKEIYLADSITGHTLANLWQVTEGMRHYRIRRLTFVSIGILAVIAVSIVLFLGFPFLTGWIVFGLVTLIPSLLTVYFTPKYFDYTVSRMDLEMTQKVDALSDQIYAISKPMGKAATLEELDRAYREVIWQLSQVPPRRQGEAAAVISKIKKYMQGEKEILLPYRTALRIAVFEEVTARTIASKYSFKVLIKELQTGISFGRFQHRRIAAFLLGQRQYQKTKEKSQAVTVLRQRLLNKNEYYRVRAESAKSLGLLEDSEAVPALIDVLTDPGETDPHLRAWVIWALERLEVDWTSWLHDAEVRLQTAEAEVRRFAVENPNFQTNLTGGIQTPFHELGHAQYRLAAILKMSSQNPEVLVQVKGYFEESIQNLSLSATEGNLLPFVVQQEMAEIYAQAGDLVRARRTLMEMMIPSKVVQIFAGRTQHPMSAEVAWNTSEEYRQQALENFFILNGFAHGPALEMAGVFQDYYENLAGQAGRAFLSPEQSLEEGEALRRLEDENEKIIRNFNEKIRPMLEIDETNSAAYFFLLLSAVVSSNSYYQNFPLARDLIVTVISQQSFPDAAPHPAADSSTALTLQVNHLYQLLRKIGAIQNAEANSILQNTAAEAPAVTSEPAVTLKSGGLTIGTIQREDSLTLPEARTLKSAAQELLGKFPWLQAIRFNDGRAIADSGSTLKLGGLSLTGQWTLLLDVKEGEQADSNDSEKIRDALEKILQNPGKAAKQRSELRLNLAELRDALRRFIQEDTYFKYFSLEINESLRDQIVLTLAIPETSHRIKFTLERHERWDKDEAVFRVWLNDRSLNGEFFITDTDQLESVLTEADGLADELNEIFPVLSIPYLQHMPVDSPRAQREALRELKTVLRNIKRLLRDIRESRLPPPHSRMVSYDLFAEVELLAPALRGIFEWLQSPQAEFLDLETKTKIGRLIRHFNRNLHFLARRSEWTETVQVKVLPVRREHLLDQTKNIQRDVREFLASIQRSELRTTIPDKFISLMDQIAVLETMGGLYDVFFRVLQKKKAGLRTEKAVEEIFYEGVFQPRPGEADQQEILRWMTRNQLLAPKDFLSGVQNLLHYFLAVVSFQEAEELGDILEDYRTRIFTPRTPDAEVSFMQTQVQHLILLLLSRPGTDELRIQFEPDEEGSSPGRMTAEFISRLPADDEEIGSYEIPMWRDFYDRFVLFFKKKIHTVLPKTGLLFNADILDQTSLRAPHFEHLTELVDVPFLGSTVKLNVSVSGRGDDPEILEIKLFDRFRVETMLLNAQQVGAVEMAGTLASGRLLNNLVGLFRASGRIDTVVLRDVEVPITMVVPDSANTSAEAFQTWLASFLRDRHSQRNMAMKATVLRGHPVLTPEQIDVQLILEPASFTARSELRENEILGTKGSSKALNGYLETVQIPAWLYPDWVNERLPQALETIKKMRVQLATFRQLIPEQKKPIKPFGWERFDYFVETLERFITEGASAEEVKALGADFDQFQGGLEDFLESLDLTFKTQTAGDRWDRHTSDYFESQAPLALSFNLLYAFLIYELHASDGVFYEKVRAREFENLKKKLGKKPFNPSEAHRLLRYKIRLAVDRHAVDFNGKFKVPLSRDGKEKIVEYSEWHLYPELSASLIPAEKDDERLSSIAHTFRAKQAQHDERRFVDDDLLQETAEVISRAYHRQTDAGETMRQKGFPLFANMLLYARRDSRVLPFLRFSIARWLRAEKTTSEWSVPLHLFSDLAQGRQEDFYLLAETFQKKTHSMPARIQILVTGVRLFVHRFNLEGKSSLSPDDILTVFAWIRKTIAAYQGPKEDHEAASLFETLDFIQRQAVSYAEQRRGYPSIELLREFTENLVRREHPEEWQNPEFEALREMISRFDAYARYFVSREETQSLFRSELREKSAAEAQRTENKVVLTNPDGIHGNPSFVVSEISKALFRILGVLVILEKGNTSVDARTPEALLRLALLAGDTVIIRVHEDSEQARFAVDLMSRLLTDNQALESEANRDLSYMQEVAAWQAPERSELRNKMTEEQKRAQTILEGAGKAGLPAVQAGTLLISENELLELSEGEWAALYLTAYLRSNVRVIVFNQKGNLDGRTGQLMQLQNVRLRSDTALNALKFRIPNQKAVFIQSRNSAANLKPYVTESIKILKLDDQESVYLALLYVISDGGLYFIHDQDGYLSDPQKVYQKVLTEHFASRVIGWSA